MNEEKRQTMKRFSAYNAVLVGAMLAALGAAPVFSADSPFYRGNNLTVLINFSAGGPT